MNKNNKFNPLTAQKCKNGNVCDKVQKLLATTNKKVDLTNELQTEIDPNVYFKRNSVNLLVGKKGSGKTYNALREVLKLKFIPKHRYTKMLYITNKPDDPTYTRIQQLMPFPVEQIPYAQAADAINELAGAKAAMRDMEKQNIQVNQLQDEAKQRLDNVLGEDIAKVKKGEIYHSIVLLDDCQSIFEKRNAENRELWRLLFENRQPKITYFLSCQDPKGMDTTIKENLDSIWVFGGYTRYKFSYLVKYIPHDTTPTKLWKIYKDLSRNQAMCFYQDDNFENQIRLILE